MSVHTTLLGQCTVWGNTRLPQGCFIYYLDQGTKRPRCAKITFYSTTKKKHCWLAFYSTWHQLQLEKKKRATTGYFSVRHVHQQNLFPSSIWSILLKKYSTCMRVNEAGFESEINKQRKAILRWGPNTYKVTVSLVHLGSNGVWKRLQSICCGKLATGGDA